MVLDLEWSTQNIQTELIKSETTISADGAWGYLYATTVDGNLFGYDATSMQFHSPAEHKIESSSFDLELQIFYKIKSEFTSYTRDIAIFSVLFKVDDNGPVDIFNAINPQNLNSNFNLNISNVMNKYINTPIVYFTYKGSKSTPDCEQTVNWYVASNHLKVSSSDLKKFTQYWGDNLNFANGTGNNRRTQNLNGRSVLQGGVQCQEQFVYFFSFFILYIFINYFIFKLL